MSHVLLDERERDYETEDALSQSGIGEEVVVPPRPGPLPRVRDPSLENMRFGSSRVLAVPGVGRGFQQTPLCLIPGCSFPARISEGYSFCSRTCGLLVCVALGFDALDLPKPATICRVYNLSGAGYFGLHAPKLMRVLA